MICGFEMLSSCSTLNCGVIIGAFADIFLLSFFFNALLQAVAVLYMHYIHNK